MGQGQSNSTGTSPANTTEPPKQSYYDLLSIPRAATDDDIKKAYRRKALELHPDRNYGDVERTTKLFAEVQTAYEVLSDPQERAWYDSHEDAILGNVDADAQDGDAYDRSIGLTTADDINRLFRRFNSNIEFSDAPSGFFGFLREFFETLAREEMQAARKEGLEIPDLPAFGHRDDDYEDVVRAFYAYWAGFSTRKSFAWRDKYRASRDMDRFMRRAMDKENKKFRDEAIREFNSAVRSLVAFVRKRDPRYKPNTQSEAERQQALRDAVNAQKARAKAENEAKLNDVDAVPEWAKVREDDDEQEEDDDESDEEQFECVACRKTFKSENQMEAHERSKKHLKAVQALRKKLKKEGRDLDLENAAGQTESGVEEADEEEMVQSRETVEVEDETNGVESIDSLSRDGGMDESYVEVAGNIKDLDINAQSTHEIDDDDDDQDASGNDDLVSSAPSPLDDHIEGSGLESQTPKMGKAAQKRAKKAAQKTATEVSGQSHTCAQCKDSFESRSRLFQHIEKFGHAAPLSSIGSGGGKKRSKKR